MIDQYVSQGDSDDDIDSDSEKEANIALGVNSIHPYYDITWANSLARKVEGLLENDIKRWVTSGFFDRGPYALHSFMLDLDDPSVEKLFSEDDWKEILEDLPSQTPYSEAADHYMDSFHDVKNIKDLEKALKRRPTDAESVIIYHCLDQWLDLYKAVDPSPFSIVNTLGEAWWINNAWGACLKVANGLPHAFILPGEKTGHDSAERKNKTITSVDRRRIGCKADLIWRTISAPERDWAIAEAAPDWDPIGKKYRYEGTFKLPRQLHDILSARSFELGEKDHLRGEFVTGLIIGGVDHSFISVF
ncbi:hypothetical protein KI688_005490 [Linnemannia hyalina]|uniref:Uncharacterized protein n=1 Tax=Linnemannia hyalina TaxID=64524 RepID=A0A9P8BNS9_9FUNG|nr:hypothetical protein KI688_005490 [Linnemannia hyalina]